MFGYFTSCCLDGVLYKGLIGQSFKCCSGFGHNDKDRSGDVNRSKNCGSVIRVYITDESCFHLKGIVCAGPILKRQIQSARTKI